MLALITGATAFTSSPVLAQDVPDLRPIRARAGGAFTIAAPVGEFADYVGTGWGVNGHFTLGLAGEGALGLRLDAGFVNYGNETKTVCLSQTVGCRITVDLTTSNNIVYANLGPELAVPVGPLQPYANLSAGFSYFGTMSSVKGTGNIDGDAFANTTNFDDVTFAWQAGAGLRIALPVRSPVTIDLGLRYHANGEVEYLREGGIEDDPVTGAITLHPIRSEANLVTIHIGVTAGIRW